jgi:FkbM family methyltransferase
MPLHPNGTNDFGKWKSANNKMELLFSTIKHHGLWDKIKTIVNLGSCLGEEDVVFSDTFPDARIFCYEPNPASYPILLENVKSRSNIFPQNLAVGESNGIIDFHQSTNRYGTSSVYPSSGEYDCIEKLPSQVIQVRSVRLDENLKNLGVSEIDLIWADIQGSELPAFRGAGDLMDNVKAIFTEVEYKPIYLGQPLYPELKQFLDEKGFIETWRSSLHQDFWGEAIFLNKKYL